MIRNGTHAYPKPKIKEWDKKKAQFTVPEHLAGLCVYACVHSSASLCIYVYFCRLAIW